MQHPDIQNSSESKSIQIMDVYPWIPKLPKPMDVCPVIPIIIEDSLDVHGVHGYPQTSWASMDFTDIYGERLINAASRQPP